MIQPHILMEIFCFLAGILYVYTFNLCLPVVALLLFFITPRFPVILLFFLGMLIAWLHQEYVSPEGMPDAFVIPHALVQGTIASIPVKNSDKTQFHFALEQINNQAAKGLIQLAWYNHAPPVQAGQRWQLAVKLKKPRNFQNPGSYDYVSSLTARHIHWTGYINGKSNHLITQTHPPLDWLKLRERLGNALTRLAPDKQTLGILEALTLNITTHISQEDWSLFRRTGTTHLFGISGEHIALISGMCFWLIRWFWSRSTRCCLYFPAISVASIGGLLAALFYAFLAGFAPPVQRALIGCFFYTVYCLGKQRLTPWQVWRYALFGVLCLEPHAVFMQGFYFSFMAVACLLLTQQRWGLKGYKGNLALQLSCLIGLMPLTLYWFSYGSINGFIANLFAIPLVGFLIVPLSLLTMSVSTWNWASYLMKPLAWLIGLLFKGLIWTEQFAAINITWVIHSFDYVIALMGALLLWVLLPIKPFKYLAMLWVLIPLFPARVALKPQEVLLQVLDVGQGLAVTVQTQNHVLLYDTGDQFFQGSDLGKMVILPFYAASGVKKLDKIVISHPDRDHLGGLKSVEAAIPVGELLVNDPAYYHRGLNCHQTEPWIWDGVHFQFLPIKTNFKSKNNNSCILQITNKAGRILLTGDIEQIAEDYLIKTYGNQLVSDVLIVPHHGSKTSSSYRFLLEVSPRYAIASLGFDNRFHFPHAKTLYSMNSLGIPFLRTDDCGMVNIQLNAKGIIEKPQCFSGLKL
jgi:competence protein ComEC